MEKPGPHKRKSIHNIEVLIDEIRENDKNSATVMISKLKKSHTNETGNKDDDDKILTSDDEGEEEIFDTNHRYGEIQINKLTKKHTESEDRKLTERSPKYFNTSDEEYEKIDLQYKKLIRNVSPINADEYGQKSSLYNEGIYSGIKRISNRYSPESNNHSKKHINLKWKASEPSVRSNNNRNYKLYIIPCIFAFIFIYYFPYIQQYFNMENNSDKTINLENSVLNKVKDDLRSISSKYKNQERNLWQEAFISIRNAIKRPKEPSIVLLLGSESDPLNCLAALLGNVSSNALDSQSLFLSPKKFQSDVGSVIESLRLEIKKKKTVVIWDLLNINVEALKAFHNLCDRINPLVEEVIFIITIIADNYDKESNPLEFIEKELFKKLSGKIKEDAIQPLITRITDGPILIVKPEPTVTDCALL